MAVYTSKFRLSIKPKVTILRPSGNFTLRYLKIEETKKLKVVRTYFCFVAFCTTFSRIEEIIFH